MKPIHWIGSSKSDLSLLPSEACRNIGYALYFAQLGDKHPSAKPLKGFTGASVLEIVEDHNRNTYRVVYTVKLAKAIYVLHVFQKKSNIGIETPHREIELVKFRLTVAEKDYARRYKQ